MCFSWFVPSSVHTAVFRFTDMSWLSCLFVDLSVLMYISCRSQMLPAPPGIKSPTGSWQCQTRLVMKPWTPAMVRACWTRRLQLDHHGPSLNHEPQGEAGSPSTVPQHCKILYINILKQHIMQTWCRHTLNRIGMFQHVPVNGHHSISTLSTFDGVLRCKCTLAAW